MFMCLVDDFKLSLIPHITTVKIKIIKSIMI